MPTALIPFRLAAELYTRNTIMIPHTELSSGGGYLVTELLLDIILRAGLWER